MENKARSGASSALFAAPYGVAATKGHVQGNGGLRGHSVGDVFPYIVYITGSPHTQLYWHVLRPSGVSTGPFKSADAAHAAAAEFKQGDTAEIPAADDDTLLTASAIRYYRTTCAAGLLYRVDVANGVIDVATPSNQRWLPSCVVSEDDLLATYKAMNIQVTPCKLSGLPEQLRN